MSNPKKPGYPNAVLVAVANKETAKDIADVLSDDYGVETVLSVADGEAAWNAAKDGTFDCVIHDWKLEKLSGVALFNRLRQHATYQDVPVLVVSELVQKENFLLLKDYPLTGLVDGGFSSRTFSNKFDVLAKEYVWYSKNAEALASITTNFNENPAKAQTELADLAKTSPNPTPVLNLAARKFRELKMYDKAESLLVEAKKAGNNSTTVMELAKIFYLTGRPKDAMVLIRNHKFSVKNVEKLLFEGEINLAEKSPDDARDLFGAVLAIDPDHQTAKSGIQVADNIKVFSAKMEPEAMTQSFASLLNLVAVTMVKSGQHVEGIDHYRAAMTFIHDDVSKARLMYNLGLAYMRQSEKDQALHWFKESERLGGDTFTKATAQIAAMSGAVDANAATTKAASPDDKPIATDTKKSA